VVAVRDVHPDTAWGPCPGILQSEGSTDDQEAEVRETMHCFLKMQELSPEIRELLRAPCP